MVGGRQVTLVQDALEEISVQSGGYNAEYGNANSGIIRQQIKSGTANWKASIEYITDNIGFNSRGNFYEVDPATGQYTNDSKTLGTYCVITSYSIHYTKLYESMIQDQLITDCNQ